jgi:hypothetical protein
MGDEQPTPQAERFEVDVEGVEMRHDTMSRDEQIRCNALHAAFQLTGKYLVDPERTINKVLTDAVTFEDYIRTGVVAEGAALVEQALTD